MRALVVDDSEPMRKVLAMMLKRLGFETYAADSAFTALAQLNQYHPVTVALIDWGLPGVDGIELVKQIRQQQRFVELKIMMTTALSESDHRAPAFSAGANEYLMKPLTPATLRAKLDLLGLIPAATGEGRPNT